VRELTGGKGADIVFNTVGDPYFDDGHPLPRQGRASDPDRRGPQGRAVQHPGVSTGPLDDNNTGLTHVKAHCSAARKKDANAYQTFEIIRSCKWLSPY
jgi:NADPH:quinone reductase-like Zn-dependent oxidoreductase